MRHTNSLNTSYSILGFFSSGGMTYGVISNAHYFVLVYYSQVLGLDPGMAGLALFIGLLVDAVGDPLIGYLSDNTSSRWGRRHRYLYASVIPLALSYFLLWHPPTTLQGDTALFLYLLVCNSAVRFSTTLLLIPAYAMVAELTSDYDHRTRLQTGFQTVMSLITNGMSVAMYAFWLVPNAKVVDGVMNEEGYRQASLFGTVVIAASVLIFTMGLHRYIPLTIRTIDKGAIGPRQFIEQVSAVFHILSMRTVMASGTIWYVGVGTYAALWVYIYSYFWEFTSAEIAQIAMPMAVAGLFLPPLMTWWTKGREKKDVAIWSLLAASVVNALPICLRLLDLFPANGLCSLFWMMMVFGFFETLLFLVYEVYWRSMTADVTEQRELETGRRSEGIIASTVAFASKCVNGVGALFGGILLTVITFPTETAVGDVPEDILYKLGWSMVHWS